MDRRGLFDLDGMTIVVTGASQGLGRQMSRALARAGAHVVVAARRAGPLSELVDEINGEGLAASSVPVDLTVDGSADALLQASLEVSGRVDVLVNNAGVSPVVQSPQAYSDEQWDQIHELNLKATFRCARGFGSWMIDNGQPGAIINLGSVAGTHAIRGVSVYAASKAGILQLTRSLAYEWGPHGIRVNALCPGTFEGEMTEDLRRRGGSYYAHLLERIPMARLGMADELDAAAVFLASPGASYVTGAVLNVDGGWSTL